ncbi:hypothetical protein EV356DRAFT_581106 [Viridothelium virens]|uniref:Uncharacterized protein n=1 Tax=Viridothelium virens TaxID=1048519 RepID=A0A6A6GTH4_VIRVR|nr:hypothetical protein EV356DRAFT_581106 [Viridothelium virens]
MDTILPLKRAAEWLGGYWNTVKCPKLPEDPRFNEARRHLSTALQGRRSEEKKSSTSEDQISIPCHEQYRASKDLAQTLVPMSVSHTNAVRTERFEKICSTQLSAETRDRGDRTLAGVQSRPSFSKEEIQLVTVNQGGTATYALTITAELAELLRTNILSFRQLDGLDKQRRALNSAVEEVREQIEEAKNCLEMIEEQENESSEASSNGVKTEMGNLMEHREALQHSLEQYTQALEVQKNEQHLERLARTNHERVLLDLLEQPLQECGVLDLEESTQMPKTESIDVHMEYNYFCADENLEESHTQRSPTPSELLRSNIQQELLEREETLEKAKEQFDGFDDEYDKNLGEYYEDIATGAHNLARTVFDNFYVEAKRQYTKELIDAEANLRETRQRARQIGIKQDIMDESIFHDDPYDGYGDSMENEMIHCAPVTRIEAWLDGVPDKAYNDSAANSVPTFECDDWDARSVDIGHSISCIGTGSQSRRIRQWDEIRLTKRESLTEGSCIH